MRDLKEQRKKIMIVLLPVGHPYIIFSRRSALENPLSMMPCMPRQVDDPDAMPSGVHRNLSANVVRARPPGVDHDNA